MYDPAVSLIGAVFGGEKRLRRKILRFADIKDGNRFRNVTFLKANAEEIPYPDSYFDKVRPSPPFMR
jgi:hypothetical protein